MLKKLLFWLVTLALIGVSLGNQMTFIVPMALIVYAFREKLKQFLNRFSLPVAFISSGLFFGLLTESFAIWSSLKLPLAERALLSPYPSIDLILGFFWYGLFVLLWYTAFKRYHYSKSEIFLVCGIYGLIFEQQGKFFFMLFSPGFIVSLFVMLVYAVFPMLAYMLTQHRFSNQKKAAFYIRYPFVLLLLTVQAIIWKGAGLIYYPILQKFGYLTYLGFPPK
jgi:uncharacterized membrane protein YvlD (DUF360 family)